MYRMLIVDDERIIRETLSRHIDWAALDVQVIGTASNGLEAYDIIMDEYPDIVMTDIKMPGFSGLELLQRIKSLHPDIEFILLSGYGEFEYAQKAMQWRAALSAQAVQRRKDHCQRAERDRGDFPPPHG